MKVSISREVIEDSRRLFYQMTLPFEERPMTILSCPISRGLFFATGEEWSVCGGFATRGKQRVPLPLTVVSWISLFDVMRSFVGVDQAFDAIIPFEFEFDAEPECASS